MLHDIGRRAQSPADVLVCPSPSRPVGCARPSQREEADTLGNRAAVVSGPVDVGGSAQAWHQLQMFAGLASRMLTRSSVANSTSTPRRPPFTMIRSRASSDSSMIADSLRRVAKGEMPPTR